MRHFRLAIPLLAALLGSVGTGQLQAQSAHMVIDNAVAHQTFEGFGATSESLVFGTTDNLTPTLRAQALKALYRDIHLTTGNVALGEIETPSNATDPWGQRRNDDADPFSINPAGFNWTGADAMKRSVLDTAMAYGFNDWYPANSVSLRWDQRWLDTMRSQDYNRYLDECAEHVLAGLEHLRDAYGIVQHYMMLFNEPLTGNGELAGGSAMEVVDIIKRVGARLRANGFDSVLFVVPGEETEESSFNLASTILADNVARQFVGAIAYHTYPYGSTYSYVPNILSTAGVGRPDSTRLAARRRLRDLGKQYGKPLWMTEVSHGGVDPRSFDALRGRAIHIHDEFVYTDASAWFGMMNMWDTKAQQGHFGNRNIYSDEGTIVLIDDDSAKVVITGTGYAVGHYARWLTKGAVRIDATSDDSLLLVSAFRDSLTQRLTMVLINNHATPLSLAVSVKALQMPASFEGEQSTASVSWNPLPATESADGIVSTTLPGMSVTTLRGAWAPASVAQHSPQTGLSLEGIAVDRAGAIIVRFELPVSSTVRMHVFDLLGRERLSTPPKYFDSGAQSMEIPGSNLTPGSYMCVVEAGGEVQSRLFQVLQR